MLYSALVSLTVENLLHFFTVVYTFKQLLAFFHGGRWFIHRWSSVCMKLRLGLMAAED